ncbi:MAG: hypothetical protein WCK32_09220 [Chlorobiaceae bacterium]
MVRIVASILTKNRDFCVDHKGLKIFSSEVTGSDIQSFKGETKLQVPFKKLMDLFYDMANYGRWVHQLAELDVISKRRYQLCLAKDYHYSVAVTKKRDYYAYWTCSGRAELYTHNPDW